MQSTAINVIVPIILLLYAIPTLFSWGEVNHLVKVSAVFALVTGICAIANLIIKYYREKNPPPDSDGTKSSGENDENN
ncbi:MAG: hypothetical protein LBL80_00060 [Ruminococcus sp.]|jgi:hypothetical protein|nr:hypothetical protein [Ruminococcus sp.]